MERTSVVDLNIRLGDHSKPLVDRQQRVISRVGARADGAEDMVERGIRSKVLLHHLLLFRRILGCYEAFDNATNLLCWILHLNVGMCMGAG